MPKRLQSVSRIVLCIAAVGFATAGELHQDARLCNPPRFRQSLARYPAALNEPDEDGMTPLHVAVYARKKICAALLLEAGANRTLRDRLGRTPLDLAEAIGDPQERVTTVYMLKNFYLDGPHDHTGPKPGTLEYAVMHRQPDVTKMLLALGADPNVPGTRGTTPLADASLKGDVESVRALLEGGARPTAISPEGTQAIHDAALGGHAEVIRELVHHGADVNARTRDDRQTPLHLAASLGKTQAAEALVTLGADLNAKDAKGRTPQEVAERAGFPDLAAVLRRPGQRK